MDRWTQISAVIYYIGAGLVMAGTTIRFLYRRFQKRDQDAEFLKELKEIHDDPSDIKEWVDVMILAFDGALRQGHSPNDIINALNQLSNLVGVSVSNLTELLNSGIGKRGNSEFEYTIFLLS